MLKYFTMERENEQAINKHYFANVHGVIFSRHNHNSKLIKGDSNEINIRYNERTDDH